MTDSTLNAALQALQDRDGGRAEPRGRTRRAGALLGRARRLLLRTTVFLLLGGGVNVAVAYALGLFVDVSQGRTESAGSWTGRNQWTVTRWSRTGAAYVLSVREPGSNWSPGQATGPPDTPTGGDQVTAWASQTPDAQAEWLLLEYAEPVVPKAVRVYEIYSTGALNRVTALDPAGREVEAWAGVDPTPQGRRIAMSEVPLRALTFATKRIKVYLDSPAVSNWNEVDAVGLVGADDQVQWAVSAEASSTYASSSGGGLSLIAGGPSALAPEWGGLREPSDDLVSFRIRREERAIEARGWPMLSLWGPIPSTRIAQANAVQVPGGVPVSGKFLTSSLVVRKLGANGTAGPVPGEPPLLLYPVWRGFLFNSGFYGVVLLGLFWALTAPRRFVREVGRMRRGCCIACGYDLGFDFAPGCPECGWRRNDARAR